MILILGLLSTLVLSVAGEPCTQAQVDAGNLCTGCQAVGRCTAVDEEPVEVTTCSGTEACGEVFGVVSCTAIGNTDCACQSPICDPFDSGVVLVCFGNNILGSDNCTARDETCVSGQCVEAPTTLPAPTTLSAADACVGVEAGTQVPVYDTCTSGVYCAGTTEFPIPPCADGEYFDAGQPGCASLPPNSCDCGTMCQDAYKLDCTQFVICDSSGDIGVLNSCPENQFYNAKTDVCEASDANCDPTSLCTFVGLTTTTPIPITTTGATTTTATTTTATTTTATTTAGTTTAGTTTAGTTTAGTATTTSGTNTATTSAGGVTGTTTMTTTPGSTTTVSTRPDTCNADNVNVNYPFPGDCKKYFGCRQTGDSTYEYVESTCFGVLVFNPDTALCDSPENVNCA